MGSVKDPATVTGTYRILKDGYDISKATIAIMEQMYTGKEIEITNQSQFVKGKVYIKTGGVKEDLVLDENMEVVKYENNVRKGTAKVTFRGIGSYGGTKTVTFKIVQKFVKND